jgi:hypothetical protein
MGFSSWLRDMHTWLDENFPEGAWARTNALSFGEAFNFHFDCLDTAEGFLAEFPDIELLYDVEDESVAPFCSYAWR